MTVRTGVPSLVDAVPWAHADAWAVQAGGRPAGATARLPGVRLACSGTRYAQYNGADVVDPSLVDVEEVAAWFAARHTPWAWRVPENVARPGGEPLVRQRFMGLSVTAFHPVLVPRGYTVGIADDACLDELVRVDVAAFGGSGRATREWLGGHLHTPGVEVGLVRDDAGEAIGVAYTVVSDGDAGPAVMLAGVGVVPTARQRGVAAGLSSWLLARGFAAGAVLAHLQPDDDRAARVYARIGFTEVPGLQIRERADRP